MAFDLIVIAGASCEHGTLPLYRKQLADAGIEFVVVDSSDKPNANGGGNLGYRVRKFRELVQRYSHYEKLVLSDAFDVTFYGSREEVLKKIPDDYVLHAAEKNCYPDSGYCTQIQNPLPWKFANGGLAAGTPESFIKWCDEAPRHHAYNPEMLDQQFLNILVAEGSPLCRIDDQTTLFFCLYGGYDELDFENGLPVNTQCETWPQFIHANGKWNAEFMFKRHERSLRSVQPS